MKYTIAYEADGAQYKLCKIWFGADGSYYVTSPYHPAERALLMKATVNYADSAMRSYFHEALDLASAEDDNRRIKLSHHPDGFLQFSGEGIISGKDSDGNIRGIGVMTWPLDEPVSGPAFSVTVRGIEQFQTVGATTDDLCVFSRDEISATPGWNQLVLEGHYLPAAWRRFVRRDSDGTHSIGIVHPQGAVLQLKVLFPPERAALQGFIGVELYASTTTEETPSPSFSLSGSTGNLRRNEQGELLGDGIFCLYPRLSIAARRSLDYRRVYIPPEVETNTDEP